LLQSLLAGAITLRALVIGLAVAAILYFGSQRPEAKPTTPEVAVQPSAQPTAPVSLGGQRARRAALLSRNRERHAFWTNEEMRPFRGGATWHILRVRRKMTKARLFASTLASMHGSILNQTDFAVAPHLMVLRDTPKKTRLKEHLSHIE